MSQKENNTIKLDLTDHKILHILQENSKITTKEISQQLNLSQTPIYERIKRLENNGVIRKYVALLDLEKINQPVITFCTIRLEKHSPEILNDFETVVRSFNEIIECYYIAGNYDYLVKVITPSMKDYQNFVINKLSKNTRVAQIQSSFVMSNVKYTTAIDI